MVGEDTLCGRGSEYLDGTEDREVLLYNNVLSSVSSCSGPWSLYICTLASLAKLARPITYFYSSSV